MSTDPTLTIWRGSIEGDFTSPAFHTAPFDRAVMSWRARGPAKFFLEIAGQSFLMGEWGPQPRSAKTADVSVDLLSLKTPATAFQFRVEAVSQSTVSFIAITHWLAAQRTHYSEQPSAAWGKILDVPQRSQYDEQKDSGDICSPTSLAMVLDFFGTRKTTREVADAVFDHAQRIYGNWSFNTAYANSIPGFESYVKRASTLADIETEILAGRPAIISHRWNEGDLDHAPIPKSNGHLIVIVGFTQDGDVIVNDPAGKGESVRRIYKRRQIHRTWLERGSGMTYVVSRR